MSQPLEQQPQQYQQPPAQQSYPPQQQYAPQQPYATQQPHPAQQPYPPQQFYPPPQPYPPQYHQQPYGQQPYLIPAPQKPKDKVRQRLLIANAVILCLVVGYFVTRPAPPPEYTRLAVDGSSNLSSNAASLEYPQGTAVSEYIESNPGGETWTAYTQIEEPSSSVELWDRSDIKLSDEGELNAFIAQKTIENSELAGRNVDPETVKIDGKRGFMWRYKHNHGQVGESLTQVSLWIPSARGSIRLKCEIQTAEFERADAMCSNAIKTLKVK